MSAWETEDLELIRRVWEREQAELESIPLVPAIHPVERAVVTKWGETDRQCRSVVKSWPLFTWRCQVGKAIAMPKLNEEMLNSEFEVFTKLCAALDLAITQEIAGMMLTLPPGRHQTMGVMVSAVVTGVLHERVMRMFRRLKGPVDAGERALHEMMKEFEAQEAQREAAELTQTTPNMPLPHAKQ